MKCSINKCGRESICRGWCRMHYQRWLTHGSPLAGRSFVGRQRAFIESNVLRHSSYDCLRWPFSFRNGYPRFWNSGGISVHRYICERWHGRSPSPNHHAAHDCGNKWCVAPRHLRWATPAENNADKNRHGTAQKAERNGNSKLTTRQAVTIYHSLKPYSLLASKYGVTVQCVYSIKKRKSWRHLHA